MVIVWIAGLLAYERSQFEGLLGINACRGALTGLLVCQQSARLEEIRLSILNNLIKYHPESGQELGWGAEAPQDDTSDILHPLGPHKMCVLQLCSWVQGRSTAQGLLALSTICVATAVTPRKSL